MYSEYDVQQQISEIKGAEEAPMRKARRLINLGRRLRRFRLQLTLGQSILDGDCDDQSGERLASTVRGLKRMEDEARLAAYHTLNTGGSQSLAFDYPAVHAMVWQPEGRPIALQ